MTCFSVVRAVTLDSSQVTLDSPITGGKLHTHGWNVYFGPENRPGKTVVYSLNPELNPRLVVVAKVFA